MNPPMKRHKTLTEYQREEMGQIIKNTLQDDYVKLELYQLSIKEDAIEQITEVDCRIVVKGKKMTINKLISPITKPPRVKSRLSRFFMIIPRLSISS